VQYGKYPIMNYRAYTAPWVGTPRDKPALVAQPQSQNVSTPLVAYVSWNGATEVKSWRFWGSTAQSGPFYTLASVAKSGFETQFAYANYSSFIFVEAVGDGGKSWANSSVVTVGTLGKDGAIITPSSVPETSSAASSSAVSSSAVSSSAVSSSAMSSSSVSGSAQETTGAATELPAAATTVMKESPTATEAAPAATTSSTAVGNDASGVSKTLALLVAVGVMFAVI